MMQKIQIDEDDLKKKLTPEQYKILDTLPNMREEIVLAISSYKEPLDPIHFFDPTQPDQVIDHPCESAAPSNRAQNRAHLLIQ